MGRLSARPLGGHIGAVIEGVDLRDFGEETYEALRSALLEYEVIFFRGAHIDDDTHMAVARRFGRVSLFPVFALLGETEPALQVLHDTPESPPETDHWHTDVTWLPEPPALGFLRAVSIPERGGDTIWGSMTAAYEALSTKIQELVEGLEVHHDMDTFIRNAENKLGEEVRRRGLGRILREAYPEEVHHPLVRTHPETGRQALYIGGDADQPILGLADHEAQAVRDLISRQIEQPRFQIRWSWQEGDFAIWDERSTVHRAVSDHYPLEREMRRCVVDGDRPFFKPSP